MKELLTILAASMLFVACNSATEVSQELDEGDQDSGAMSDVEELEPEKMEQGETIELTASLTHVAGRDGKGSAIATYDGKQYVLVVSFEDLPELEDGFFYEGWVVRSEPLDVISTGELEMLEGDYVNIFSSDQDLTDHEKYILTLEPDDGDPAPAEHVLEGEFQ